jgi:hypothetical protein
MNGLSITCLQCGHSNSSHRLWCENCRTPVPSSAKSPVPDADHSATDCAQLYGRVLQDLSRLSIEEQVNRETYDVIKAFYQGQTARIEEQTTERNRARELYGLVFSARMAAHSGRFQDAIELLRQGLGDDHGEHPLKAMIAEIDERNEQRERELQASREADELLGESNVSIARLEAVADKLEQARQLDPNNKRIIATLNRVRTQIGYQQSRELPSQTLPAEDQEQVVVAKLVEQTEDQAPVSPTISNAVSDVADSPQTAATSQQGLSPPLRAASFADDREEIPSPRNRLIEATSQWSSIVKPFLLDNVGWFVGAFLVVAGFVVLIVTFWGTIEQNRILMHSLVYVSLAVATGMFFSAACFMRLKHPQLESSSNVLLVIVALLIPLVFAAAILTSFVPAATPDLALFQIPR